MGHDIIRQLAAAVERGEPVVLATVVRTDRSVPRRPGSKMLVHGDGRFVGTIGGGEMEARVLTEAAAALADGAPRLLTFELLDPASGDPGVCGGTAEIYLEPHMPDPLLFIVGAGHVGRAVSDLARWLGFRVVVWDDRPEAIADLERAAKAGPGSQPSGEPVRTVTGPITEALTAHPVDQHTSVVMVTRNVSLDVDLLPPLLASGAGYIGLMGSRRRWTTTRSALVDAGVVESDLDRIVSPIGIEIKAETPEEIAVSILAQVVGHRRSPADPPGSGAESP